MVLPRPRDHARRRRATAVGRAASAVRHDRLVTSTRRLTAPLPENRKRRFASRDGGAPDQSRLPGVWRTRQLEMQAWSRIRGFYDVWPGPTTQSVHNQAERVVIPDGRPSRRHLAPDWSAALGRRVWIDHGCSVHPGGQSHVPQVPSPTLEVDNAERGYGNRPIVRVLDWSHGGSER